MSCKTTFHDHLSNKGDADLDIVMKVDHNATQSIYGQDIASSEHNQAVPTSTDGTDTIVAGPQSSIKNVTTNARATTELPHKRTVSKLLEDERDVSSVDNQRRRTGFASYVGLSNSAW